MKDEIMQFAMNNKYRYDEQQINKSELPEFQWLWKLVEQLEPTHQPNGTYLERHLWVRDEDEWFRIEMREWNEYKIVFLNGIRLFILAGEPQDTPDLDGIIDTTQWLSTG